MLGGALLVAAAATAGAQNNTINLSDYQGPGVLSRGVGDIGMRSGEQVQLRYYAGVSGTIETNLAPFAVDAQGNLIRIHNLYGLELSGGVYGVHSWKRSQLAVDYLGSYQRNLNSNAYNGSNQSLSLGYTVQATRRLTVDLRESVGTALSGIEAYGNTPADPHAAFTPTTILFDARTNYGQSSLFATYAESARTSFSFGGSAFIQDRKSVGLANSYGYDFTGSMQHRLSRTTTAGATYTYSHNEFKAFQSYSDSNTYHGTFATVLGRFWTFSLEGGVTVSEVNSQVTLALDPVLAALLGRPTITAASYVRAIYPSGTATLQRKFRNATLGFNYFRGLNSGNGIYTASRLDTAMMSISYTAARKLNLGLSGGYTGLVSIGQDLLKFSQYSGSLGLTYTLGRGIHASASYLFAEQEGTGVNYNRSSSRAVLGLIYSPGSLPLALW